MNTSAALLEWFSWLVPVFGAADVHYFLSLDDASDLFLPLPSDVTNNESVDCSTALCIPLEAEKCGTDASVDDASDWLESSDQSLPSLQHLRTDTPIQSQADLQISMEQLSLTHESLCETDVVADPTVMDVSRMPRSPLRTCLQEESLTPTVQLPSQEVTSATPQHQSAVEENMLRELLERAQVESTETPHRTALCLILSVQ